MMVSPWWTPQKHRDQLEYKSVHNVSKLPMLPHHRPHYYILSPPMGTTAAALMLIQGIAFSEDTPWDGNEHSLGYLNTVKPLTLDSHWIGGLMVPFLFLYEKVLTQQIEEFMHEPEEVTHPVTRANNIGIPCTLGQSASFVESWRVRIHLEQCHGQGSQPQGWRVPHRKTCWKVGHQSL